MRMSDKLLALKYELKNQQKKLIHAKEVYQLQKTEYMQLTEKFKKMYQKERFINYFNSFIEGDYCNAEVGDSVIINKDVSFESTDYKDAKGIIISKFNSSISLNDKTKEAAVYVVEFDDIWPTIRGVPGSEMRKLQADFDHYDIEKDVSNKAKESSNVNIEKKTDIVSKA